MHTGTQSVQIWPTAVWIFTVTVPKYSHRLRHTLMEVDDQIQPGTRVMVVEQSDSHEQSPQHTGSCWMGEQRFFYTQSLMLDVRYAWKQAQFVLDEKQASMHSATPETARAQRTLWLYWQCVLVSSLTHAVWRDWLWTGGCQSLCWNERHGVLTGCVIWFFVGLNCCTLRKKITASVDVSLAQNTQNINNRILLHQSECSV